MGQSLSILDKICFIGLTPAQKNQTQKAVRRKDNNEQVKAFF